MRRRILVLGGLAGAMVLVAQAQARPPGPPPMADGAMRAVMAMTHGAGLTDAQHDQVRATLKAARTDVEASIDALRDANEQLTAQLLDSTPPDEAALRASLDKIASLRASLLEHQVQTALTVRGMLSAEQLAAAAADTPPAGGCHDHPPGP
jgi:Spy/CpxP family protein refolding chaperone